MSESDQKTMNLKTVPNTKVYDLDGKMVNVGDLKTGMLINVNFPILEHRQKEGAYYLAKQICIIIG